MINKNNVLFPPTLSVSLCGHIVCFLMIAVIGMPEVLLFIKNFFVLSVCLKWLCTGMCLERRNRGITLLSDLTKWELWAHQKIMPDISVWNAGVVTVSNKVIGSREHVIWLYIRTTESVVLVSDTGATQWRKKTTNAVYFHTFIST